MPERTANERICRRNGIYDIRHLDEEIAKKTRCRQIYQTSFGARELNSVSHQMIPFRIMLISQFFDGYKLNRDEVFDLPEA